MLGHTSSFSVVSTRLTQIGDKERKTPNAVEFEPPQGMRVRETSKRKMSLDDGDPVAAKKVANMLPGETTPDNLNRNASLSDALDRNDILTVRNILENDLEFPTVFLEAALLRAAREGKKQIAQLLLSHRPCVTGHNNETGCKVLIVAAKRGYFDIVKMLLNKGVPVNYQDDTGKTALMVAIQESCCSALIILLLELYQAFVNLQDNEGKTALMLAVERWDYETVHLMFSGSSADCATVGHCDETIQDRNGHTALDYARMNGSAELLGVLLESRKRFCSPLCVAAGQNNLNLVRRLLQTYPLCVEIERLGEPPLPAALHGLDNETGLWDGQINCSFELMDFLLQAGVSVNDRHSCGFTPLMFAATAGSDRAVEALLMYRANVNDTVVKKNELGHLKCRTALLMAAEKGWANVVEILLQGGAVLDVSDRKDGENAFVLAVKGRHKACVQAILKRKGPLTVDEIELMFKYRVLDVLLGVETMWIRLFDEDTWMLQKVLCIAVQAGCHQLVKKLTNHGADVNFHDKYSGGTYHPMYLALQDVDMVRTLLDLGANVNMCLQGTEFPALMHAVFRSQVTVVRTLLEYNADMYFNCRGQTALTSACYGNKIEMVRALLNAGMDVNHAAEAKPTALGIALKTRNFPLAEMLIKRGANVNSATADGATLLMLAMRYNTPDFSRLLIDNGADVNAQDHSWETPLFYALNVPTQHKLEKVDLLLQHGAGVNLFNLYTKTPLMVAAAVTCDIDVFKVLLASGPNLNAQNINGDTAVHVAVEYCYEDKMKLLAIDGADLNVTNVQNRTPLMLALRNLNSKMMQALLDAGASAGVLSAPSAGHPDLDNLLRRYSLYGCYSQDSSSHTSYSLFLDCLHVLLTSGGSLHKALSHNVDRFLFTAIYENQYEMVKLLVQSGVAPHRYCVNYLPGRIQFILDSQSICNLYASPVCLAIIANRPRISALLGNACFLHKDDMSMLQHPKMELRLQGISEELQGKSPSLAHDLFPKKWSLYKWSKLAVLRYVGYGEGRTERVMALPIPNRMKDELLYKDISWQN